MQAILTDSKPLLLRLIHQAEDLCASSRHAAYYLRRSQHDHELSAVESGMSMAGYLLRSCGWTMERGYIGSFWFEMPNETPTAKPPAILLKCLLGDLRRAVRKLRKAIKLTIDPDARHELRLALICTIGVLLPLRNAQKTILDELK